MSSSSELKREATHHEMAGNGSDLSRQVTLNLSAEQYEKLFFAPAPARGETALAKRLGMFTFFNVKLIVSRRMR